MMIMINIRHTAVAGLLHALNGITNYKPDKPHENLINKVFHEFKCTHSTKLNIQARSMLLK